MKNTTAATEPQAVRTIGDIQWALARRFGMDVETDTGRATLSLARDRVELTDKKGEIVATGLDGVIAFIGVKPTEAITVTLDPVATKLVRGYAEEKDRDVADVVSGVLVGQIGHLREEEESHCQDDTGIHIEESVLEAIQRRKALRKAA